MAEYIKRADVMKICEDYSQHCFESSDARGQDIADRILDDIAEMPTADVQEVPCRCKDCRYSKVTDNGRFHNKIYCFQPAPIKQIVETEEERFCSYGKRKKSKSYSL